jgi:hypothetical protein
MFAMEEGARRDSLDRAHGRSVPEDYWTSVTLSRNKFTLLFIVIRNRRRVGKAAEGGVPTRAFPYARYECVV